LHIVARQRNALPTGNRATAVDDILRSLEATSLPPISVVWQPASETKFQSARSITYLHQAPNVHMERIRTNAVMTTIQ
jgi:hypothetical protein